MRNFRFLNPQKISDLVNEIQKIDLSFLHEKIMFGLAVDKKDDPKPSFFIMKFISKDEAVPEDIEYDYGDYLIIRKQVSIDYFFDFLEKIKNGKELGIHPIENHVLKMGDWDGRFVSSNMDWGFVQPDFPTLYFQGRLNRDSVGNIVQDHLVGNNNPPYPTADKAIAHLFNLRITWGFTEPAFVIIVPDMRARIKQITISDKKIRVEIESKKFKTSELLVQMYVSGEKLIKTENLEVNNNFSEFFFEKDPEEILVCLSTKSGEIVDQKEISLKYLQADSSVKIETPAYSLHEIIKSGEGKHVEFKSKLDHPEPFITSVISFANTDGGRIFVGVDDYGDIIGVKKPEEIESKIMNWVAQYSDPRIDVHTYFSNELGTLVVEVPVGKERPYYLKTGGCFIRHGATDRQATRVEVENMKPKQQDSVGGVRY